MLHTIRSVDLRKVARQTEIAYSASWRELPIRECGEPLVQVPPEFCHSFYALEMRLTDDPRVLLEEICSQDVSGGECGY